MTYQEKSIWASLIATSIVCARFIVTGGQNLVATVTLLVAIQILAQIAVAVGFKREPKDERDRLIDAKAYRTGYLILVIGTIVFMNRSGAITARDLLIELLAAEIGKSAMQLIYYRQGV